MKSQRHKCKQTKAARGRRRGDQDPFNKRLPHTHPLSLSPLASPTHSASSVFNNFSTLPPSLPLLSLTYFLLAQNESWKNPGNFPASHEVGAETMRRRK